MPDLSYDALVDRAFARPDGGNREYVRSVLRACTDELLDFVSTARDRPVLPSELAWSFDAPLLNEQPMPLEASLASIRELFAHSMNAYSPTWVGHMDSLPTLMSVVGDLLASGLNNNLFGLEMSPYLTQLEHRMAREFCLLFGFGDDAGGLVLGGGTLANLQALTVARNSALGSASGAVAGSGKEPVFFCSEMAHVSVRKSAMILGLGAEGVVTVPVDAAGHMDPAELERRIGASRNEGKLPAAVVATAGTTVTGNIDPLGPIADVCADQGVWLHVDAIWGGGLVLSRRHRGKLRGIERADSIAFNPQKWMMVAKTCSLVLFRRFSDLETRFRMRKDYVREHDLAIDLSEIGLPGTKRADVLKLWLSVQSLGLLGYERYVDRTMEIAAHFVGRISERPILRTAYPMETAMTALRGEPDGTGDADAWNADLQEHLLRRHDTFVSLPTLQGRKWLRVILLNPFLTPAVVDGIFAAIDEFAAERAGAG